MLRLRLQHARPGMELALPIHHPRQPSVVLLQAGVPLDALSIPHLRELGVEELWIKYPGLEHLVRLVDPELVCRYRQLTHHLGTVLDQALVRAPVDMDFYECRKSLLGVVARLGESPRHQSFLSDVTGSDRAFVRHCGNVAALTLLMGTRLDFYLVRERPRLPAARAKLLADLGVGALFHDIGLLRLPAEVLHAWNTHHDTTDPAWRMHVTLGFEMVRGVLPPAASAVVLHHHQAWDGTGFPQRPSIKGGTVPLREHDIHIFPRLVAAADTLDRLLRPAYAPGADRLEQAGTNAQPMVRALKTLAQGPLRATLDPVVFRALMSVAPPFAPGTLVTLSNGSPAVVVDWTPADPCRPTVDLLDPCPLDLRVGAHHRRRKGKPKRLDLRSDRELRIVEADGQDVSADFFEPAQPGEFDLAALMRSMGNRAYDDLSEPTVLARARAISGGQVASSDGFADPDTWDLAA